jgi:D-arginine dehydrogenase
LSRASRAFLLTPPAGFSTPLVKPRGVMFIAAKSQLGALTRFAALPDIAAATTPLTAADALRMCPVLRPGYVAAALHEPDAADMDVHGLHQGYIRLLRASGGHLLTDRRADRIARRGDLWEVNAGGDTFSAPIVVNAAGAWADEVAALAGVAPIGLTPLRRTAILVDPPADVDIARWPLVLDIDEQFYFKPDAGRLLISPADETPSPPCDIQPEELDIALAVERVETATTLAITRIKHRWAGLRSFVADRTPVAGFAEPGFFWLAAQGGYGIQTCPALARLAAALVMDKAIPIDLTDAGVIPDDLSPARLSGAAQRRTGGRQ